MFVCTNHTRAEVVRFRQKAGLDALLAARRIIEVDLDAPSSLLEFARLIDETPLGAGEASSLLYAQQHGCIRLITTKRASVRRGVAGLRA